MTGPKFAQRAVATWWAIQMLHASLQLQRRLAWEVFKSSCGPSGRRRVIE